jgi:hypothetical protein
VDLTHQYSSCYAAIRGEPAHLRQEVRPGTPPTCQLARAFRETSENSVKAKFSIAPARRMKRPGRGGEGGACCKEVVSAPQILATLPLFYRNTDGAALSFTPRPRSQQRKAHSPTPIGPEPSARQPPLPVCGCSSRRRSWCGHPRSKCRRFS